MMEQLKWLHISYTLDWLHWWVIRVTILKLYLQYVEMHLLVICLFGTFYKLCALLLLIDRTCSDNLRKSSAVHWRWSQKRGVMFHSGIWHKGALSCMIHQVHWPPRFKDQEGHPSKRKTLAVVSMAEVIHWLLHHTTQSKLQFNLIRAVLLIVQHTWQQRKVTGRACFIVYVLWVSLHKLLQRELVFLIGGWGLQV